METTQTMDVDNLKGEIGNYFKAPLADFYGLPAQRLMIGAVLFILTGLGAALALGAYDRCNALIDLELKFIGTHAWHAAANMTVSFILTDLGVAYFLPSWGAYHRRTVGKAWIVLLTTFLLGFIFDRALTYRLVALYDPALYYIWKYVPSLRADALPALFYALPFWLVISSVVIKLMTAGQACTPPADAEPCNPAKDAAQTIRDDAPLALPTDPGIGPIRARDIGHITAEDHYLRVHYHSGGQWRTTLIRMPLKALARRLPRSSFVRIHRSHMVNLAQVAVLKRKGRTVRLAMKHGKFDLPVSRSRQPDVLPLLDKPLAP